MSITAMKQALEALENWLEFDPENFGATDNRAVTALRQAIEQAEKQEPVAWRHEQFYEGASGWFYADWHPEGLNPPSAQLLYATPQPKREFVGLTDEDLSVCDEDGVILARYWEAKLKEKNGWTS